MSFLDNLFTGNGIASALATPIGAFDVSQSTPVVGNVLTVLDVNTKKLGWRPGGAGGGGGTGAPKLESRLIFVTDEASAVIDAVPGTHYFIYANLPFGTDLPKVRLPSSRDPAVTGQTIRITFYTHGPQSSIELMSPIGDLGGDYPALDGFLYPVSIFQHLEHGTYECQALFDPTSQFGDAYGFWFINRTAEVVRRRDQDIDWAMPGWIPDDAIISTDPLTDLPTIEGTWTPLPFDGNDQDSRQYRVGDLILVHSINPNQLQVREVNLPTLPGTRLPRATNSEPGIFEVLQHDGPATWKLRLAQFYYFEVLQSGISSESYYRIRNGWIYRQRTFRQAVMLGAAGGFAERIYALANDELELYPRDGELLDGLGNALGPFTTSNAVFGKVNLFALQGADLELSIALEQSPQPIGPGTTAPAPTPHSAGIGFYAGQHIAVRCELADAPHSLRMWASNESESPYTIEDAAGATGLYADFAVQLGTYIEWVLGTDGVWKLLHYRNGAGGGGGGQFLPYVDGQPTPNCWVRASSTIADGVNMPASAVDGDVVGIMVDAEGTTVWPQTGVKIQSVVPEIEATAPDAINVEGMDYYEWVYLAPQQLWQPRQQMRHYSDAQHGYRGGGPLHTQADFTQPGFMSQVEHRKLFYASAFDQDVNRTFRAKLPSNYTTGYQVGANTIEWVYLGKNISGVWPITGIAAFVLVAGAGTQDAQFAVGTSPQPPNQAQQSITVVATMTNVSPFTGTGKRGAVNLSLPLVPENSYVWLGLRCTMGTTQPTFAAVYDPMNQVAICRSVGVTVPIALQTYATQGVGFSGATPPMTVDLHCQLDNSWG